MKFSHTSIQKTEFLDSCYVIMTSQKPTNIDYSKPGAMFDTND